jgi:hypothetical protein
MVLGTVSSKVRAAGERPRAQGVDCAPAASCHCAIPHEIVEDLARDVTLRNRAGVVEAAGQDSVYACGSFTNRRCGWLGTAAAPTARDDLKMGGELEEHVGRGPRITEDCVGMFQQGSKLWCSGFRKSFCQRLGSVRRK